MSSIIFNNGLRMRSADYGKCSVVSTKRQETLAEFVKRVRESRGMSLTDVEKASARKGNKIAGSYVSRIENGIQDPEGVSPKKLQGLALGLDVSVNELLAVILGKPPVDDPEFLKSEFFLLYQDFHGLSPQKRRDFKIAWQMAKDAMRRIKDEG